ncbi:efflux RND transporter periplasmic adaptor subunit [Rhizobium leguminosarum]|uniref:efflux RND transporter periplasmic adaptor subunit n=1 Tax=Rhizobium leguminosarum TaxID=384 RepID=UPI00036B880F|nr:efflux RND transporter periplasmic adaptor subunit [Rhizobium leguminosarum]MBY2952190.1 efflux RND transporter periplasmic adaptor subunit [Rhizobium leguminosarum]MBY2967936.1 efflux RND transporter periplasmic adaptor subunit [Rhizobium leguminosarum]MBY2988622.1 efflux RND transporter periplasmic adaptor subunit [Rhizobium leguminosarum]MBY2996966.1 efflux RND transporter periplasmic adaptor subunit [Rhizobium leguminosarum]MBY3034447.1 efflux RND transporter periplasmic adaptor subunit
MRRFAFILVATTVALTPYLARSEDTEQSTAQAAALTVAVAAPRTLEWPVTIPASGRLAAWHEAVIAAEVSGLKISDVRADVGTAVKKGDLLVQFDAETSQAELEQQQATVEKQEAALDQAVADAERARGLTGSGALSKQQTTEYLISERKAKADVLSAKAALASAQLTLERTKVYAVDDGVISERSASLGNVVNAGDQLFKLIRQNRVEWKAELPVKRLADVKEGTKAVIKTPVGDIVGEVRLVSPTTSTDNGRVTVYVTLQPDQGMPAPKTGILASGYFEFDQKDALTVPETAVTLKDGFSYVFILKETEKLTVARKRVETGRRQDDRVEIVSGIDKVDKVVTSGGAFLADGSVVRVSEDAQSAKNEEAK